MTVGLVSIFAAPPPGFPGQSGNPVGFAATPTLATASFAAANGQTWPGAYPGSLTTWPGGTGAQTISAGTHAQSGAGTSGNPWVFSFYDFDASTSATAISLSNAIFVGCRFQSNANTGLATNINPTGSNLTFIYSSVIPRVAIAPSIPNAAWPSASAGLQILNTSGSYASFNIPNANGYQFAFYGKNATGPLTIDFCDSWGFANFCNLPDGSTFQFTFTNSWIHDCRNDNGNSDHSDGPGYLNTSTQPSNILIQGCTIASIGNTNAIAMQGGTGNMNNLVINANYLTGFGFTVFAAVGSGASGCQTTNNVFGTDLPWLHGPLHDDNSTIYTTANGNLWRLNKLIVLPGTSFIGDSGPSFTSANNGQFLLPNKTFSVTDWAS